MAKAMTRPRITVEAVYLGTQNAREAFTALLVSEVKRQERSVRTFEQFKNTDYNTENKLKEVS